MSDRSENSVFSTFGNLDLEHSSTKTSGHVYYIIPFGSVRLVSNNNQTANDGQRKKNLMATILLFWNSYKHFLPEKLHIFCIFYYQYYLNITNQLVLMFLPHWTSVSLQLFCYKWWMLNSTVPVFVWMTLGFVPNFVKIRSVSSTRNEGKPPTQAHTYITTYSLQTYIYLS